ncbi:golgin subfamily A member 6-like protein 24 isoform X2 [Heterodontus francisci]|uniref:golgin subfamily A member 6-like protein 24 isoform X2 n=2 Tax=Heterodontus francisci TaxID=7792 RepID=UPI00355C3842
MDAVQSIDHLETEKTLLLYEVERLRDILEGTEEELAELHRKHTQISRELETEKVAKHLLQQKINCMEEQLEEGKKSQDTEITATKNMDKDTQSNINYHGYSDAKKMGFKSDKVGKHSVEKLQDSAAAFPDVEEKHLTNGSFETESNRQHKIKTTKDISNGIYQEGTVNIFTQQGADDTCLEGSTTLIKDSENVTVVEKGNSIHSYATEREESNEVMEGCRSEALEQLELGIEEKVTEYKESKDCKEKGQNELILEVSKATSQETVQKREMNEKKSEGNEAGRREEVSNEDCLSNRVEGGVRKQVEEKKKIMMEMCGGKNLKMGKEKPVEVCGSMTEVLKQVDLVQDHRMTSGESRWEGIKEKNRETIASEIIYKIMEMDNKGDELECCGEELVGRIERAQDKWPESGREGGEVITPFQCMKESVSSLVKDGDSVNLKQDMRLDKDEQHEGMLGKEVFEDEAQSQREEEDLENENPVRNQEMDKWLQGSIDKINKGEDSRIREGENVKEKVDAGEGFSQGDNKERNETNVNLDMREQETVTDGQEQIEGKETQNEGGTEQNNAGKEKGPFEMLEQLFKKIVTGHKSFSETEGKVNREDHVDYRGETDGEKEEEIKDEEYLLANEGQHVGKENKEIESTGEIEEVKNEELSRKGLVESVLKLTVPEGNKTMTELIEEAKGVVADLSNEEMHDAAESIAPEQKTDKRAQESKPKTEEDPEGPTTNDDVELRENVNNSESTKRHIKHRDTCQIS